MLIFDFLRKLFGWADERPRKRRAVSFSADTEFVTPKKKRCEYTAASVEEEVLELENDSDSDEIAIIPEEEYSPIRPSHGLNGTHCSGKKPHIFCSRASCSTPAKSADDQCDDVNMVFFRKHNHKIQTLEADHKVATLAKTHRLKERTQYQELLQNFLPRRIHILRDKRVEGRTSQSNIELIELDKSSSSISSSKPKPPIIEIHDGASHSRWSTPNRIKKEKEIVITIDDNKKDDSLHSRCDIAKAQKGCVNLASSAQSKHVECVATNTLRDKLAAKAVMRGDFIPQISKRYNERIEQRCKEAEELKKMTCVLSKHNRLAREVALEEQLARSMRLCEAVLDEREEPEEPTLPTLTDAMIHQIKNALIPRPPDEILVEGFGLRITRKDIHTLADLNWLNDEVINFYMNLLIARSSGDKYPNVHAMNTFFYPKLISGGHASLKRWTRKIDIFAQDLVVVPIHLGIHWCMSIIDFRDKIIRYYDSMGSSNPKCLAALRQYLEDESLDKKKQVYNTKDWKLESAKNIPQQMNGSDCGVFSCMFAEFMCANKKITFTQQDMPYFRNKMVYEILKSKLL